MILEALLLTTLLLLLGSASYTDCRVSHIWNRHLGYAAVPIFLLDFAYYSPLVGDGLAYWQPFLLNAVCLALTGLLLYALHIWAAGDTKLLLLVALVLCLFAASWVLPGSRPAFWMTQAVLLVAVASGRLR